jgi:hypothetical protein
MLKPAPPGIELGTNGFIHRFQITQKLAVDSNGQATLFPTAIRVMAIFVEIDRHV